MRRALFSAVIACALATVSGCAEGQPNAAAPTAEDAKIQEVVRAYLLANPEVVEEALLELDRRRAQERRLQAENDPRHFSLGPKDAAVTVVEYYDYRCGFCKSAMDWVVRTHESRPDVRFVFKEFPVLGPQSLEASQAAIAALRQGGERYFKFHRALMAHRGDMSSPVIDRLAREAGIDVARMRRDMDAPEVMKLIQDNYALAEQGGVQGTPAFMINGEFVYGFDQPGLERALREATEAAAKAG